GSRSRARPPGPPREGVARRPGPDRSRRPGDRRRSRCSSPRARGCRGSGRGSARSSSCRLLPERRARIEELLVGTRLPRVDLERQELAHGRALGEGPHREERRPVELASSVPPLRKEPFGRGPPGQRDLAAVRARLEIWPSGHREVLGVEPHRHPLRGDPVRDRGEQARVGRRAIDRGPGGGVGGDETRSREGEAELLEELAHGAGAGGLLGRAEPLLRQHSILGVDRAAREGHVAGEEPASCPALDHEDLEPLLAVPPRDHRGRASKPSSHARDSPRDGTRPGPTVRSVRGRRRAAEVSDLVLQRIVDAIRERGPISFAEFMELALYGPGGFYERTPIGARGHFVTSPHVHPVFAELLLRAVVGLWEHLERPTPLRVVEVGAGDGTLAAWLLRLAPELDLPISYSAVERSPGARERLLALDPSPDVREQLTELGPLEGAVVIANELLDNLPFRRVRGTAAGVVEVRVGLREDRLAEVEGPLDERLEALAPRLRPGEEAVVPVGALAFVEELAS